MSTEPDRPVIANELLRELGDWRTEKEGRSLAAAGAVQTWQWEPPFLHGTVRSTDGNAINARLKLSNRAAEVENLCSCRQARVEGTICAHVMALVFATIAKPAAPPAPSITREPEFKHVPLTEAGDQNPILELMILLPLNVPDAWRRGEMRVLFEGSVAGAAFTPFDAIPKEAIYAVSDADERVLAAGRIAGIWSLPGTGFDKFFEVFSRRLSYIGCLRFNRFTQVAAD